MFAIAGKEKSYEVVGCKVYQVGLTPIVLEFGHDFTILFHVSGITPALSELEFGHDFKLTGLMSVLFCFFQKFFFNGLDIKNISLNILVVLAVEA